MPKTIPDYSNSCIYKLVHKEDFNNENVYVGSTTNFIQRKKSHKKKCNIECDKEYNKYVYQHIRANGGWENWVMIQIEPFSCNSKKELETRERYWIETLKSILNCVIPTRTKKEYYDLNRDKILEKCRKYRENNKEEKNAKAREYWRNNKDKIGQRVKKYREENKDKIKEINKKYYEDNVDKLKEYKKKYEKENKDKIAERKKKYRQENADKIKEQSKKYYEDNADKIKEHHKKYYEDNADKIAERDKEKINCDICGCEVRKQGLKRHKRTQKCMNFQK